MPSSRIPVVPSPPRRHVDLAPLEGKGIWLTTWRSSHPDVKAVVARVHDAGLDQIWVRTGSSTDGFYGGRLLAQLVPLAHAEGISVIAWDFPTLSNPAADARRAGEAFEKGADAFSPDIETPSEGTHLGVLRARYYLSLVRHEAGNKPVVATVFPPNSYWAHVYPYSAMAPFVDAFAPMVYWSCSEPGAAVAQAIEGLRRWKPVVPVGQDFDMGPMGGRQGLPTPAEIWRFLDVAHRLGAPGASLFDLESGGPEQLSTLGAYPWTVRSH
ncbi:MAG TPA: hypothetical protein VFN61_16530 [Acidimicrobiales bacterium]|nr:hypothetical protein [Acidimicrobiales bacterium]